MTRSEELVDDMDTLLLLGEGRSDELANHTGGILRACPGVYLVQVELESKCDSILVFQIQPFAIFYKGSVVWGYSLRSIPSGIFSLL